MKKESASRLRVIQKEMHSLNEEALSLLSKGSSSRKIAKLHWYSTIKCALGYNCKNKHFQTIDDSVDAIS